MNKSTNFKIIMILTLLVSSGCARFGGAKVIDADKVSLAKMQAINATGNATNNAVGSVNSMASAGGL